MTGVFQRRRLSRGSHDRFVIHSWARINGQVCPLSQEISDDLKYLEETTFLNGEDPQTSSTTRDALRDGVEAMFADGRVNVPQQPRTAEMARSGPLSSVRRWEQPKQLRRYVRRQERTKISCHGW